MPLPLALRHYFHAAYTPAPLMLVIATCQRCRMLYNTNSERAASCCARCFRLYAAADAGHDDADADASAERSAMPRHADIFADAPR